MPRTAIILKCMQVFRVKIAVFTHGFGLYWFSMVKTFAPEKESDHFPAPILVLKRAINLTALLSMYILES